MLEDGLRAYQELAVALSAPGAVASVIAQTCNVQLDTHLSYTMCLSQYKNVYIYIYRERESIYIYTPIHMCIYTYNILSYIICIHELPYYHQH